MKDLFRTYCKRVFFFIPGEILLVIFLTAVLFVQVKGHPSLSNDFNLFGNCKKYLEGTQPEHFGMLDSTMVEPERLTSCTYKTAKTSENLKLIPAVVTLSNNKLNAFACDIECPENISTDLPFGDCSVFINLDTPTVSPDCSSQFYEFAYQIYFPASSGNMVEDGFGPVSYRFEAGVTRVRYLLIDFPDTLSICEFEVELKDQDEPKLNCPSEQEYRIDGIVDCDLEIDLSDLAPDVEDECPNGAVLEYELELPDGNEIQDTLVSSSVISFPIGETSIDWIYTDRAGNSVTCQSLILIKDTVPPSIASCPSDYVRTTDLNACSELINFPLLPLDNLGCGVLPEQKYTVQPGNYFGIAPNVQMLPVGQYTVTYEISDFSGNTSLCTYQVAVRDQNPPRLLQCPRDRSKIINPTACYALDTIMLPDSLYDDCLSASKIRDSILLDLAFNSSSEATTLKFIYDGSSLHDFTDARIQFFIWGDADDPLESFSVMSEDGDVLSNTSTFNLANCERATITTIELQKEKLDGWLADDNKFEFELIPNNSSNGAPGADGDPDTHTINDFCPDQSSGKPRILALLTYDRIQPFYYRISGATDLGLREIDRRGIQIDTFFPGISTVELLYRDLGGNEGTCSYEVNVLDDLAPSLTCVDTFGIELLPSKNDIYFLEADELVISADDNCRLQDSILSLRNLDCSMAGQSIQTEVTIIDQSGNTAACSVDLIVRPPNLQPNYFRNMCSGDSLILLGDPSVSNPPLDDLEYEWYDPSNVLISEAFDPILEGVDESDSGTYTFIARSSDGLCSASGTIEVEITSTPGTVLLNSNKPSACPGDQILLSTSGVTGNNVRYEWYEGIAPDGTLLGTSSTPEWTLGATVPGVRSYYLIIVTGACTSAPSNSLTIETFQEPSLDLMLDTIEVCQESVINLSTTEIADQYEWTGPNNYAGNEAMSLVSSSASFADRGWYLLRIQRNGCWSNFDSLFIDVLTKPERPSLQFRTPVCENDQLVMQASTTGEVDEYIWRLPDGSELTTSSNTISIDPGDYIEGFYSVAIQRNQCRSEYSIQEELEIEYVGDLGVSANLPICEGETLNLRSNNIQNAEYTWTGPSFNSHLQNPVVNNPLSGRYILLVQAASGCIKSDTTEVIVSSPPNLTGIMSNVDVEACLTGLDSVVLSPLGVPIDPDLRYTWENPDGDFFSSRDLVLLNADETINGVYSLIVYAPGNCPSEKRSIDLSFSDAPIPPQIVFSQPVCEGDELILNCTAGNGNNLRYIWETPQGRLVTTSSELRISNASSNDSGNYRVQLSVDGCTSLFSSSVNVQILDAPSAPIIFGADSAICRGDSIVLSTLLDPQLRYEWNGPNAFGDQAELVIPDAESTDAGEYTLQVINSSGCYSPVTVVQVLVNNAPSKPILSANTIICPGDSLLLRTNAQNFDSLLWTSPLGATFTSSNPSLQLGGIDIEEGNWTVEAFLGSCASPISDPLNIRVDQNYTVNLSSNSPICYGDTLRLQANFIANSQYQWTNSVGNVLGNQRNLNLFNPSTQNYILQWTSPLGCKQVDSLQAEVYAPPRIDSLIFQGDLCVNGNQGFEIWPTIAIGDNDQLSYTWVTPRRGNFFDSILIVQNADVDDAGQYTLEVQDQNGCISSIVGLNIQLYEIPSIPVISQSVSACEGEDIILQTQEVLGLNVSYKWTTPLGNYETTEPVLNLSGVSLQNNGPITVRVEKDNCTSSNSLEFIPNIKALPPTPQVLGTNKVCEGDTIYLETDPIAGASYIWRGPNFSPGIRNPSIPRVSQDNEGYYRVQLLVDGCRSAFSDSFFIDVLDVPAAPNILPIDDLCMDLQSGFIEFSIDPANSSPGALYKWFIKPGNIAISDFIPGLSFDFLIDTLSGSNYSVYAQSDVNGCISANSISQSFEVFRIPDTIEAKVLEDSINRCGDNIDFIRAETPPEDDAIQGNWRQVGGPNSITILSGSSELLSIAFDQLEPRGEYSFEWSLSYGNCGTISRDTVFLYNVDADQQCRVERTEIEVCNQEDVTLQADPPLGRIEGSWEQDLGQEVLGVNIVNPTSPTSRAENLVPGNTYFFDWVLTHPECGEISRCRIRVDVVEEDPCSAFAGVDEILCSEPQINLRASTEGSCQGFWKSLEDARIDRPGSPQTTADNLQVGLNRFVWTVENLQCGLVDRDTVEVIYYLAAEATDDQYDMDLAGILSLNLLENDLFTEDATFEIIQEPEFGRLETFGDSTVYFAPIEYLGEDLFTYRLCDLRCMDYCDTAAVRLNIGGDLECIIPTLITPNEDGVNDAFIIPCLAGGDYPDNEVSIFNQWGDEIFHAAPYQNDWRGRYHGNDLPDGTYYFIVRFGNRRPSESGFIIIQR